MTSFASLVLRQRTAVILVAIILLIAGILTGTHLPEELLPNVAFNTISVVTVEPGGNPNTVLKDVTKPVEIAVASIPGLNTLASTSSQNVSVVTLQFNYGVDINAAVSKVSSAVAGIALPTGVQPSKVASIDFGAFPIMYLAIKNSSQSQSLQQTYSFVKNTIAPQLTQLDGVAAADVGGGADQQLNVTLDPAKLAKYGLSIGQVDAVLQANNINIPGGTITYNGVTQPVVTTGNLQTVIDLNKLPITIQSPTSSASAGASSFSAPAGAGAPVPGATGANPGSAAMNGAAGRGAVRVIHLSDIASLSLLGGSASALGTTPGQIAGLVRYNGHPAVSISIRKNSDANIVTVANEVQTELKTLHHQYPNIQLNTLYDSSTGIKNSVNDVVRDGFLGAIFAVVVIFAFLLTVRTTLVTAVSIPLSIFTAIIVLGTQGISLNIMTLSGIAVAVGRVVDDAIVVLENIYRHTQDGEDRYHAVVHGTAEVGRAIAGSTITTVAVFLPIAFVGGIIGQFFAPFALTVVFAVVASLVVALTVVPALASIFVVKRKVGPSSGNPLTDQAGAIIGTIEAPRDTAIQRTYTPVLVWALSHRFWTILLSGILFIASLLLVFKIPTGLFPQGSQNIAQISVNLPAGASLDRTSSVIGRLEKQVISKQAGLQQWESIIGYDNQAAAQFGNSSATNAATILAVYSPDTNMTTALKSITAAFKPFNTRGINVKAEGVSSGPPTNINIQVTGQNQSDVARATRDALAALSKVKYLSNLSSNLQTRQPQVIISVDPQKALLHGLTPSTAAFAIRSALTGQTVGTLHLTGSTADTSIFVQLDPSAGASVTKMESLVIGAGGARVSDIASVSQGYGPVNIARQSQETIGQVTSGISGDAPSTGSVTANVAKAIKPVTARWSKRLITIGTAGASKALTDGFTNMGIAMIVAIGLVFIILVVLFRSLLVPLVILVSLPLATIGALIGLFVTQHVLDLSALIGMLMLIGIVVTNAIVLLDLVQTKMEHGDDVRTALYDGGRTRVRPILMTATATILALIPLALSSGGGLIAANLAVVVIGGLFTSTLLTLVVIPVVFSVALGTRKRLSRSLFKTA